VAFDENGAPAVPAVKFAEKAGVDGVICEGFEAGGHKGFTELTSFVLIPMVSEAVRIPVVAGGGIGDARGVIAAMALGADGVYMGTRFMATTESDSHPDVKDRIVRGEDVCTVSLPKDKMLARDLSNDFTGTYLDMKRAGASSRELNEYLDGHSQFHAQHLGRASDAEICCGQVAGLITDIRGTGYIMSEIAASIRSRLEGLKEKMNEFLL
jgi:NAD(P)H-dependent flavin oxidoreductase YrpB (nitropropane dioxygenase family)